MLTLLIAAAAAASPMPPSAGHGFGPRVISQAQASVRIVRGARISFDHPRGLDEAQVHHAAMRVDGAVQQAQLIEFE